MSRSDINFGRQTEGAVAMMEIKASGVFGACRLVARNELNGLGEFVCEREERILAV